MESKGIVARYGVIVRNENYMKEKYECNYQSNPVCPYCGSYRKNPLELFPDAFDGDTDTIECYECEKEYKVTVNVDITYHTETVNGWGLSE